METTSIRQTSKKPTIKTNMTQITFNKIEPQTVEIWNEDGFFARVNEYEFNDIRIQIMNNKAEGFYAVYEEQNLRINKDGKVENWPRGFFDTIEDQLEKLVCF